MIRGYETAARWQGQVEFGAAVGGIVLDGVDTGAPRDVKRSAVESTIAGVATTYLEPHKCGDHLEVLAPGCFGRSLTGKSAIRLLVDHKEHSPIATTADHLELFTDEKTLSFRCAVPATRAGQEAMALLDAGARPEVSVGYHVIADEWRDAGGTKLRVIWDADLREISLVRKGAVPGTRVKIVSAPEADGECGWNSEVAQAADRSIATLNRLSGLLQSLSEQC